MRKPISAYEVVDHGIDGASYFQGCGISYTNFNAVATGAGDTFNEALDDALEGLAQQDWAIDGCGELTQEALPDAENEKYSASAVIKDACECEDCEDENGVIDCQGECNCAENAETYYYVSVRVR